MPRASLRRVRLAIPQHQGRISPVFDAAGSVLLVDVENGREMSRQERSLGRTDLLARAREFLDLEAQVLICGAISAPLEAVLVSSGVRVIGFLCGPLDEVLAAFLRGGLPSQEFWMPGCGGWRKRLGRTRSDTMPRGFGMGSGRGGGGGRGRGAGGSGRGRMGGPAAGGPGGSCVCPSCGEKMPHTAGQPCNQVACPKCGTKMTRG
jgi:predicted Fe-Mo cluster-binding NifX family protein